METAMGRTSTDGYNMLFKAVPAEALRTHTIPITAGDVVCFL
jgi:hypothetical protein